MLTGLEIWRTGMNILFTFCLFKNLMEIYILG